MTTPRKRVSKAPARSDKQAGRLPRHRQSAEEAAAYREFTVWSEQVDRELAELHADADLLLARMQQ